MEVFLLVYCGGGAGSLRFPPSENPCVDDGISGCVSALSIDEGCLRADAADCAPIDETADCGGGALGLAYNGRCVFFASTSTSRSRFDSCIPCDTQSTSVAGCNGTLTDELNVARTSTMLASGPRGRTRKLYTDDEFASGSAV